MRLKGIAGTAVAALAVTAGVLPAAAGTGNNGIGDGDGIGRIKHIVVIYEENHSFDNLYGTWGPVNGQTPNGLASADPAHTVQQAQDGTPYGCLKQNDPNLTSPPLSVTCTDSAHSISSHFTNTPFDVGAYIPPSATTCPNGTPGGQPGGCTRDLVHRFYNEQFQIDGGKQDRYVQGSDAVGLSMGHYDTTQLPIYQYLHGADAPNYRVADNFFQGAFGGSFLNHQVLVAAQALIFANADRSGTATDLHSAVDRNDMPTATPLYSPTAGATVKDQPLTEAADANGACAPSFAGAVTPPADTLCGDYAVNTIQPMTQPYAPGTATARRLPLVRSDNIGDHLTRAGVSWAWYAGGWDNAAGNNGHDAMHPLGRGWTNGPTGTSTGACAAPAGQRVASGATFPYCPDSLFQFHHQPFGYFANYADGTQARVDHLKDEQQFLADVRAGSLPSVSFVKPVGEENEHPGYASETNGSNHLVDLLRAIHLSKDAKSTLVVVTYDEFGGTWDHVPVPGTPQNPGPHDVFGPGTRIPALVVSDALKASGVDHEQYDTTSILAGIEHRFRIDPVRLPDGATARDARVNPITDAFGR